ncbi:hypothetical protein Tco_1443663, partial [Tanacetum coccineum]
MTPSGLLFLIFDVHYDVTFNFMPLRQETQSIILYELFFKLPQCELDVGLKMIENEMDLEAMYDYAHEYGIIHDEVKFRRKTVIKDAGNMSVEELLSWAEEEAAMDSKCCDD